MDFRKLGASDLKVSSVCLGTMTFGQQNSESEAHAQLDAAFARGVNFIDAAEMYPVPARAETYGRTESIVGSWLRGRPRDSVVLATKVAGPGRNMAWIRGGPLSLDRSNIREAVEASLTGLGTDYIDLYQTHWPDHDTTYDETMEVLDELVRAGKIAPIPVEMRPLDQADKTLNQLREGTIVGRVVLKP